MKYILFLLPIYLFSFEVTMIDETAEGIKKAKQNEIAKDGKIIYKPIVIPMIKPMTSLVVKSVNPSVVKPIEKNIIYPIGEKSKVKNKAEAIKEKSQREYFIPQEKLKKSSVDVEEIKIDTSFSGLKENSKPKTLIPVNIE